MAGRLSPQIFLIPVEKIKSGYFTDKYFSRTREILKGDNNHVRVLMQVFTRKNGILCGVDEAAAILQLCSDNPSGLTIHALRDGDRVSKNETVMTIDGDYSTFAHLETVYLGVLARGTSVATAVRDVVGTAKGKAVLFFSSRFDHYLVQSFDGYAAHIGGAQGVSTDANGSFFHKPGIGTIPHGLIAAYNGDNLAACKAFLAHMPRSVDLIALVDFQNDCVGTSLAAASLFGRKLWGVRIDTAGDLRDVSVTGRGTDSFGVCPELVFKLRDALDSKGYTWVRIVVSGGFNRKKIKKFIDLGVPFDAVGVGSAFFKERIDFTADVVMVNGNHCAKVGREMRPNDRLEKV